MRKWMWIAAVSFVTGGVALADRPPPGPYPYSEDQRPEDHDRYVPEDSDRPSAIDPEEQARMAYMREMARCGENWMCKRHVRHEWAEHHRFRF